MNPDSIFERAEDMVWRQIGEESILVPVRREAGELESVFNLNGTAAFIWSRIDGKKSVAGLLDDLLSEFDVDRVRAEADLNQCLAQLVEIAGIREVSAVNK